MCDLWILLLNLLTFISSYDFPGQRNSLCVTKVLSEPKEQNTICRNSNNMVLKEYMRDSLNSTISASAQSCPRDCNSVQKLCDCLGCSRYTLFASLVCTPPHHNGLCILCGVQLILPHYLHSVSACFIQNSSRWKD